MLWYSDLHQIHRRKGQALIMRLHGSLELVWVVVACMRNTHTHTEEAHSTCIQHFIAIDSYHFACHQFNRVTEFTTSQYTLPVRFRSSSIRSLLAYFRYFVDIFVLPFIFGCASTPDAFRKQKVFRNWNDGGGIVLVECNSHAKRLHVAG